MKTLHPRRSVRLLLVAALAATGLVVAPVVTISAAAADPVTIDLLSINDFHGRLEAAPPAAGAAVLAGMVSATRAANPNTIFAAAGDLIGASTFTSFIQHDEPTIAAFNSMGLDVSSFGNHEFDQGRADVDGRVVPHANWPYLAANIYDRATNAPAYQQYDLETVGGVTVGFVGAVTEELPSLVSPAGIATLEVKPIVPEINRVADQLSDGNPANGEADVVVLLVHEGAATPDLSAATDDSAFGRIVTGADANIDMIVSGHTHLAYNFAVPIAGTDRTRPVISAGQYGEKYADSKIQVDATTHQLLGITSTILPLAGAFPPDPAVAAIVADAVATASVKGAVSLGSITEDLKRAKQTDGSENRGGESPLSNLIADAQLAATQDLGTQLALMNPGGIRADLLYASSGAGDAAGNVSYREAATVQPFANTLVTETLTGDQLKLALEQQWQPAAASRPFLKLGVSKGLSYVYDPTAPAGAHVTAITLNGAPVTPTQSIKVVVNSFLGSGGDNFTVLGQGTGKADSGRIDLDAFVSLFQNHSPVSPDLAQRAVGVTIAPPANGTAYRAGESVALALSSLLFSSAGATTGTATVALGSTVLGTAALSGSIVDTTDEQGTGALTITIPSGVSGAQTLTITGPGGTSVSVPITVAAPVATRISAAPDRAIVFRAPAGYHATITTADGSAPVGTVTVLDGRKVVATIPVTAASGGTVTTALTLKRGVHLLTARFDGAGFVTSTSRTSLVLVL
jgi:5'-nucleotidase